MISVNKWIQGDYPNLSSSRNNVSHLVDVLSDNLEEGFQYFPSDQITDHPERFLVSEMIREKVLQLTREEIPHSVAVVIDSMKRDEETDTVHIRATIMVERDSQKGIVIGKKGAMLKEIGNIKRTEKILEDYEMKLHMYSDYIVRSQIFDDIMEKYADDSYLQEQIAILSSIDNRD